VSGINPSRTVILTSKTDMAVEERRFSKMQNWRYYFMKTRIKRKELAGSLGVTQPAILNRLKTMGMIQKQENWVSHNLKPRDVERRLFACEQLLERQRRKGFLHRIVTEDEKLVHYDNPKCRKLWGLPDHTFTSTAKSNIHSSKVMLCI